MKEILSCSYLCFCSAKLRFFKLCKFSFWKGKPLFYRFLWYYRFFCFLLFAIFRSFFIAHFVQNPRFHRRKAIMLGIRGLISSRGGTLLSKEILTFKARECLASGGGGVWGFIRLKIRLNSSENKNICALCQRDRIFITTFARFLKVLTNKHYKKKDECNYKKRFSARWPRHQH